MSSYEKQQHSDSTSKASGFRQNVTLLSYFLAHLPYLEGKKAYTFLDKQLREVDWLTFGSLNKDARRIAAELQKSQKIGNRMALIFPPSLDFIRAFFGCVFAGIVAVPILPPRSSKRSDWQTIEKIAQDSEVNGILTIEEYDERVRKALFRQERGNEIVLYFLEQIQTSAGLWCEPELCPDDLVFLQYTSGSTGRPKGVMVSHGNLLHNEALIKQYFEHDNELVLVGWLPFYHDMGLIGNILQPFYCGGHAVLMAPMTFLRQPELWLRAISQYRAVTSGGPNFAYQLCVDKVSPGLVSELNLTCWNLAFTGAESIRGHTLDQFVNKFSRCGVDRGIFQPGYGLAESTLLVTTGKKSQPPMEVWVDTEALSENRIELVSPEARRQSSRFVSSGTIRSDQNIKIVEPDTSTLCLQRQLGEIWLSSGSVAQGYWGKPQFSEEIFQAFIAEETGHKYLRTGDLGFILDDNLFIVGRLKDLIIIRGQNHAPEDIEVTAFADEEVLQASGGAAFSIDNDTEEQLVILHEVKRTQLHKFCSLKTDQKIRQAVLEKHQLLVDQVVLVKPATLPRTSSGKIQRHLCKSKYLAGDFVELTSVRSIQNGKQYASDNQTTEKKKNKLLQDIDFCLNNIMSLIFEFLNTNDLEIKPNSKINSLMFDSLRMVEFHYKVESYFSVNFEFEILFSDISLSELARIVNDKRLASDLYVFGTTDELAQQPSIQNVGCSELRETGISPNQHGLLYISQIQPDIPVYNIPVAFRIKNILNLDVLQQVLIYLINRHDVLRSCFRLESGNSARIINPYIDKNGLDKYFKIVDASSHSVTSLTEIVRCEAQFPFDLTTGPLLRVKLYQLANGDSVLLMTNHHIITDLSSLLIIFDEFFELYTRIIDGGRCQLSPLVTDYEAFTIWQQEWLKTPTARKAKNYWEKELDGELPILNLPKDRLRSKKRNYDAASYYFEIDSDIKQRLLEISSQNNTSLYTVMLSAYQILLCRLSGQQEVVVGSPTSSHANPVFSNLVGYCLNPVMLRTEISKKLSFTELLANNRKRVINSLRYQHYPLQKLLSEIKSSYPQNVSPYFQTLFYLFKPSRLKKAASFIAGDKKETIRLGKLDVQAFKFDVVAVEYDLNLWIVDAGDRLLGEVAYNSSLFDLDTMERFVRHYKNLLRSIILNPTQKCSRIQMLDDRQYQQIVENWSRRSRYDTPKQTIHQRFQMQAEKTPDHTALNYEQQYLSYAELDCQANRLVHYISAQGAKIGDLIGLCMPRSIDMLVSMLAILKAGCAYVPLDPDYPRERLSFMLKDSGLQMVLTQQPLLDLLQSAGCKLICLDKEKAEIATNSEEFLGKVVDSQQPAYVIYTSGSTGNPKGVLVTHSNIVSLFNSTDKLYQFNSADTWTLFHSFAFDFSVWEIWGALLHGAKLVIVPYWICRYAEEFYRLLIKLEVTVLNQTPTAFRQLLAIDQQSAQLVTLRYIIFGGETLDILSLKPWFRRYSEQKTQLGPVQK